MEILSKVSENYFNVFWLVNEIKFIDIKYIDIYIDVVITFLCFLLIYL